MYEEEQTESCAGQTRDTCTGRKTFPSPMIGDWREEGHDGIHPEALTSLYKVPQAPLRGGRGELQVVPLCEGMRVEENPTTPLDPASKRSRDSKSSFQLRPFDPV